MSNKKKIDVMADVAFEILWNKKETQEILRSHFLDSELFVYKGVMFYFYLQGVFDDAKRVNGILKSLCDSNEQSVEGRFLCGVRRAQGGKL